MKNEEILKKAIEKAEANGWCDKVDYYEGDIEAPKQWTIYKNGMRWTSFLSPTEIIFSHDFAKAFWGEEPVEIIGIGLSGEFNPNLFKWQQHLQRMVLEENPIKYLEKFLD